jgi:hypothetical protein
MNPLLGHIRAAVAGYPREYWPKIVAVGAQGGAWDVWEGLEALRDLEAPTPCGAPPQPRLRLPPRTRLVRWEERPETPCGRFVRAMNLDPVLDWSLCDGAVRCLQLVLSLAGGAGRPFVTLTSSIAKQLGRTARTVQNYWNQLAGSGVIKRTFDRKTGLVTVTVTKAVEPPPAPEKPAIWPRLPSPKGVFRRALRGGAKFASHIKTKVEEKRLMNKPGLR